MDIFHAVILGIIEGLTEFLPISSTGHLIVAAELMGLNQDDHNTAFKIIIQLAAILAVFATYAERFHPSQYRLWIKVFIAFLPIASIGFLLADSIEALFNVATVAWMFIIGGVIFLVVEHFYKESQHTVRNLDQLTYKQTLWVGFAQIFALIPGTSRAGATIIGGMLTGLDRKTSAEFSFLLALPVLTATSGYSLLKHYDAFAQTSFTPLIIGFIVSFLVAWLSIKLFLKFLQHFTFRAFGIYRILLGSALLIWFV
ncbi:undecaprenyl-diphosphate phosphatase [Thiomicrospira cyclica]|uniref:Undecaprenyl-diphosphatase n=1 Tax=Thiomicrospira cyclica (strain DSM 14477 / JCM 11371 / ALM1) TaxID=717773 RepID=F6D9T0_THICA|nr:undecaprenyl-diphosphate phosphatase [Thiomicrospira cyclica]AEG32129.1 Undecaprenyl-diphosphatase [Thiomicrospira cyclica ALM1]